jgi:hypothetical protein
MKTLWLGAACSVMCVAAAWCSRTTYGQPPQALEGTKMIALDDAILDAGQILFVDQSQTDIRVAFKGLPSQGNGAFATVFVRKTPDNWRKLATALGVPVPTGAAKVP